MVVLLAPIRHSFLHPHTCCGFIMDGMSFFVDTGVGHMTFFANGMSVDGHKQGFEKCLHAGVYPLLPLPSEEQASANLLSKEDRVRGM